MAATAAGSDFLMVGVAVKLNPPKLALEAGVAAVLGVLAGVVNDTDVRPWPNLKPVVAAVAADAAVDAAVLVAVLGVRDAAGGCPNLNPPLVPVVAPLPGVDVMDTAGVADVVFPKPNPNVVAAVVAGALSPNLKPVEGGAAALAADGAAAPPNPNENASLDFAPPAKLNSGLQAMRRGSSSSSSDVVSSSSVSYESSSSSSSALSSSPAATTEGMLNLNGVDMAGAAAGAAGATVEAALTADAGGALVGDWKKKAMSGWLGNGQASENGYE